MKQPKREVKTVINFSEEWRKNIMERDKEEIVFMLKMIGKENMRLRKELKEKESIQIHQTTEKEKLSTRQ